MPAHVDIPLAVGGSPNGSGEFFDTAGGGPYNTSPTATLTPFGSVAADVRIATLDFNYRQFGYALGYLAGKMSKTGKGGWIGAQKIKFSTDLEASYKDGFMKARPDGQVFVAYTNDWDDIAKGKEAALNQISQGADVIFPTMDNAAIGSLQAAQEKGIWAFGLY